MAELIAADISVVDRRIGRLPGRVTAATAAVPAGTLVTLELFRRRWDVRPRRWVLGRLSRLLAEIEADTSQVTVVAAAIVDGRRVLVARRSRPTALAGRWEFPGGKVERGETAERAIVRECAEELGCRIIVEAELGRRRLDAGAVLVLFRACLAADSATPVALEHSELRWARAAELPELDWVATNRQFVPDVTAQLSPSATVPPQGAMAYEPPAHRTPE
ncbi:MAG TPA: (deoxy)nucleoside triphosphate pyrophosphohydrolase [Jatrophihabitans sp.]|nr:(deoxy)nucleoside triphosphate pyrophosphohydrolase [Jatrophihabitans sp.]